ncbi:hypothetical protein PI126_g22075 [Phytophthora idaei]|nr:hypothetical protein PI126_g22075 [Phytophthora idaei]
MEISSSKSLKKALEYLVAMNFIKDTPRSITSFLRIYHDFFDETEIGDYLGEGDEDIKVQVRLTYVRAISFKGMTLVESLRHFLTNGGFRLPDDIAHNPKHIKGSRVIPKATREASVSGADLENEKFRGGIAKAVAQSEELVKDLLHTYNTFQFVGVDTLISPDLIKFFGSVYKDAVLRPAALLHLNVFALEHASGASGFVRFTEEGAGFVPQEDSEEDPADKASKAIPEDTKYEWIRTIEAAAASDDPKKAMGDIHLLVNNMKETIQVRQKSEKLDSVIQRIKRAHLYLKNSTTFIHEGDLTKKCRSRNQLYRFFLFNDQLLYADKSMTGKWSPHNSLRLKLTRISNISDGFFC